MSTNLHTNVFCFYAKIQLQMFQLDLYHELSFTQSISSYCIFFLVHILKMMKNVVTILQPTVEYSTLLHVFLFAIPFCFFFFNNSTSSFYFCLCSFFCASFFFLLFFIIFQSHFLHSCFCDLQNFENVYNL
jgi:hypothetical protein